MILILAFSRLWQDKILFAQRAIVSSRSATITRSATTTNGGVTLIEFGIVLLVLATFSIGIYSKAASVGDEARLYRALDEVMLLITKSSAYKNNKGNYASISITQLNTDGYSTDPVATGTAENPWGLDYTIVSANTNKNMTLSIGTNTSKICTRLSATLNKVIRNATTQASCGGDGNALLSMTLR